MVILPEIRISDFSYNRGDAEAQRDDSGIRRTWQYALLNHLSLPACDVIQVIIFRIAYLITITLLLPVTLKYGHNTYHYHFYCRVYSYCL